MEDIIAADSLNYIRWKNTNPFHGLIGATVSFTNPTNFKANYATVIKELLEKKGLESRRIVYSSSMLAGLFFDKLGLGYNEYGAFLRTLVESLSEDLRVSVFYSTCSPEKYPKTVIYTGEMDAGRTEEIPTIQFLRDWLSQYHNCICAWKLTDRTGIYKKNFLLDGFRGPITVAWNQLTKSNNPYIIPLGDNCNAFVSFADIVARCVDESLRMNKLFLDEKNIKLSMKDVGFKEFHVHYTFHNDMENIVPLFKDDIRKSPTGMQISVKNYRKRPIVFLLKEGSSAIKEDTEWLKQTPFYDKVCDIAYETDGSVSFYDRDQDTLLDGDKVVYYGPKGKEMADEISQLMKGVGRDVETVYSRDLLK